MTGNDKKREHIQSRLNMLWVRSRSQSWTKWIFFAVVLAAFAAAFYFSGR